MEAGPYLKGEGRDLVVDSLLGGSVNLQVLQLRVQPVPGHVQPLPLVRRLLFPPSADLK